MKILILTEMYYPVIGTSRKIIDFFIKNSFNANDQIVVLCEYEHNSCFKEDNKEVCTVKSIDTIAANFFEKISFNINKLIRKILGSNRTLFYSTLYRKKAFFLSKKYKPDCIIAFSLSMGVQILSCKISKKYGIPYFSYYIDPYILNVNLRYVKMSKKIGTEFRWLKQSAGVGMPSEYFRKYINIYKNISFKFYEINFPLDYRFYKKADAQTEKYFLDVGIFYKGVRPFNLFVEISKKLNSFGYKVYHCGVISKLYSEQLPEVRFIPTLEFDDYIKCISSARCLIFLDNLYGDQIPSKIYEYILMRKPVLFFYENEKSPAKKICEFTNNFYFIKIEDIDKINVNKIEGFIENFHSFISKDFFSTYENKKNYDAFAKMIKKNLIL